MRIFDKKALSLCVACAMALALPGLARAQDWNPQGLSANVSIADHAGALALGGGIQSPLFFGHAALRAEGYLSYQEGLLAGQEAWMPFALARIGLAGYSGLLGGFARLYGSGGVELAFPSPYFSTSALDFGGWGSFGFEFFAARVGKGGLAYYIELGSSGSGARAGLLPGTPRYLNGFTTQAGLRYYL
jgi:hypothetical protein